MVGGTQIQKKIVPAPILVVLCLGAGWAAHHFDRRPFLPELPVARLAVSVALFVLGLALGLAALSQFRSHKTPTSPYAPATTVVASGVFRYTRNPMYLGFVLLALGMAVGMNSLWLLLASALLFVLLHYLVVKPEEAYLAERFGPIFSHYCSRTRRWF